MIVYFHRNPKTYNIFYVGIASENFRKDRPYRKDNRNNYWHHYVNKHDGFIVEIVGGNLSIGEATILERFYISIFGKKINGGRLVNLADGGETNAGYKWTDLQKEKLSFAAKKRGNIRLQAPEIRAKAAKTLSLKFKGRFKGIENPNYGNKWTEEMKQNLSKKKTGRKFSEDQKKLQVFRRLLTAGNFVYDSNLQCSFLSIKFAADYYNRFPQNVGDMLSGKRKNTLPLQLITRRGEPVYLNDECVPVNQKYQILIQKLL